MTGKQINKYSDVELLDIIRNSLDSSIVKRAEKELESRNLTDSQKVIIEEKYLKFKKFQENRKNMPLSREEWFSFFLLPFITPKPHWRSDHYSQSETDRFKKYGFDKKLKEAEKVQIFGTLFWLFVIIIGAIVFSNFL